VVLDSRIYLFLGILSGLAALGILLLLTRKVQIGRGPVVTIVGAAPAEGWLTGVFVLWIALTAGSYLWYNLRFVQHQGRYLFPALVPLSMFFAAGLHEVLSRSRALLVAGVCLTGACSLVLMATLGAGTGQWPVWMLAGTGVGFALRRVLPGSWGTRVQVAPYLGLFALDWVSLFGFIVPYLS
jgi:hypothetical protein